MFSPAAVIGWLIAYKYFVLFPLVAVEGPIVTILAGFLTSLGQFNTALVLTVAVLGDLAGDCLHYAIGRWGREKFIGRWGKYVSVSEEQVSRLENHFRRHKIKTLAAGKISHGIGGIPLVAAGAARMPLFEFLLINFFLTLPKSVVLFFVGFYFGQAYAKINSYLEIIGFIFIGAVIAAGAIYFFYWPRTRKAEDQ